MPYTSVSKTDRNRFGLRSHTIPTIIAIAYMVDSIEAEMTLLRVATLILAAYYVVTICVAAVQRIRHRHDSDSASISDAGSGADSTQAN